MLSLIIHEGSDHCRKEFPFPAYFVLQLRYLYIPHGSPKKAFYCLKIHLDLHAWNCIGHWYMSNTVELFKAYNIIS